MLLDSPLLIGVSTEMMRTGHSGVLYKPKKSSVIHVTLSGDVVQ